MVDVCFDEFATVGVGDWDFFAAGAEGYLGRFWISLPARPLSKSVSYLDAFTVAVFFDDEISAEGLLNVATVFEQLTQSTGQSWS